MVGVSTPCEAVSTRKICVFVPRLFEVQRYGSISDPEMRSYPPRVRRDLDVVPRANPRRVLTPCAHVNQQSASGVGVSTPCGAVSTGGIPVFSPGWWSCRDIEEFLSWGWDPILPGCDGTSTLSRGATFAVRWLHEPRPISN